VLAVDLPGFAASPMPPPGTAPGIDSLVRLVGEFVDGLGVGRPHVAGNSLGGWIALELAKRGRVSSATALSPAGFHTPGEAKFQRGSLMTAVRAARLLEPYADQAAATPTRRKLLFSQFVAHPERVSEAEAVESTRALARAPWFDATLDALVSDRFTGGGPRRCCREQGWSCCATAGTCRRTTARSTWRAFCFGAVLLKVLLPRRQHGPARASATRRRSRTGMPCTRSRGAPDCRTADHRTR
jgi:pimeloyl-ACP methyl ester carboxylesterase